MSDAAQATPEQTTTATPPSTPAPVGPSVEELEKARREAEQWKALALSNAPPAYQQQQYEQPANQRAFSYQDTTPQMPSSQLALENPQEYDNQMRAYITYSNQLAVQSAANFVTPQLAESGKWMSQNDPKWKDVWAKYGTEIEQEMVRNQVPAHLRNKGAWDLIAKMVQGEHYRDLANELADQRLQGGGFGTEGASNVGGAPAVHSDPLSAFWSSDSAWVQRAKAAEMTLQGLREHIRKLGVSEQKWVDDMNKGRTFSAEVS